MPGTVYHFMIDGTVILGGAAELFPEGKEDGIVRGTVEGAVALCVIQMDVTALGIIRDDPLCARVGACVCGQWLFVLCGQPLALIDVEDVKIAQKGDGFLLACVFVLLLDPFPEHDQAALFTLVNVTVFLLALPERDILAGATEKQLIQQGIGLACDVADCAAVADPRLLPRDNALLQLFHDAPCDFIVEVHFLLLIVVSL